LVESTTLTEEKSQSNLARVEIIKADSDHYGPFVKIRVHNNGNIGGWFYARLDTGADISIMPESFLGVGRPNLYRGPLDLYSAMGDIIAKKVTPMSCEIEIIGITEIFKPVNGVLASDKRSTGLIGMDILTECIVYLYNGGGVICRR